MNKRIQELMKQSGAYDYYEVNEGVDGDEQPMIKFAELIVKECADIAKHHVMNISTYADANFVEEQIQKHFGVEE